MWQILQVFNDNNDTKNGFFNILLAANIVQSKENWLLENIAMIFNTKKTHSEYLFIMIYLTEGMFLLILSTLPFNCKQSDKQIFRGFFISKYLGVAFSNWQDLSEI